MAATSYMLVKQDFVEESEWFNLLDSLVIPEEEKEEVTEIELFIEAYKANGEYISFY